MVARLWGEEIANGCGVSFWGSKIDYGNSCTTLKILKIAEFLKMVNYILYALYLNKVIF